MRRDADPAGRRAQLYAVKTEAEWMADVQAIAHAYRWPLIYHTHNSRHSAIGFPDLVLVRAPQIVFAELKTEGGALSREQARWGEAINQCGRPTWEVWRPGDVDLVHKALAP